jgi:gluconate 2-dehydrogenase gamma chain
VSKTNLEWTISRRRFLHRCGICTGSLILPAAWAKMAFPQSSSPEARGSGATGALEFRFFNPARAATVEAVTDQIIPADQEPGAKWAGVVHYIDLGLANDLKDLRPAYSEGIQYLETLAHRISGKIFADLQFAEQTKVLDKLEHDETPIANGLSGREFFELMRKHTLEGFFGDPKHDRSSVGWKVLGFVG